MVLNLRTTLSSVHNALDRMTPPIFRILGE